MKLHHLVLSAAACLAVIGGTDARASDLYVGSLNTVFASGPLPGGALQDLGACGGQVAALAAEGDELYLAATFDLLYRYRRDTQQSEVWTSVGNEQITGLALRGHELYVATASSKVMVFDRSRGVWLRQWDLPLAATTLHVDRGHLYAGTNFGAVMEIAADGNVTFLGSCGSLIRGIASSATELFLASSGFIWRVDRATGFVTTAIPVAQEPTGVVHDQGVLHVGADNGVVYTYDAATGQAIGAQIWGNPINAMTRGGDSAGAGYCYGDSSVCPCGVGDPFGGCPHYVGIGARLVTYGSPSVAADDFELAVLDLPTTTVGRFYMGGGITQVPFGNGLLCAGSGGYGQFRFPVQHPQSSGFFGAFRFGPGIVAHSHQQFGPLGAIQPGSTWQFQAWFRDVQNPCGGRFNTSNATSVTFQP